jgi:hypothetical protein
VPLEEFVDLEQHFEIVFGYPVLLMSVGQAGSEPFDAFENQSVKHFLAYNKEGR